MKILDDKHSPGALEGQKSFLRVKTTKARFQRVSSMWEPLGWFCWFFLVTAVVSADVSPFPVSPVQPVELGTATPPSLLLLHSLG